MNQINNETPSTEEESVESMKTTLADQVASLLMSLSFLVGLTVVLLAALYVAANWRKGPVPIILEAEQIAGREDNAPGFERDLEPPSMEEVEQLTEPTLEETLAAIESLTMVASLEVDSGKPSAGDSRPPGPAGEGDDIIPRFERWDLKFTARDSRSYALQLDFFNVELAAIGGGRTEVDYVRNLSGSAEKRSGPGEAEKRLYFLNRNEGPLLRYERDFLGKAGIPTTGRLVLKLLSKELEEELAVLEKRHAMEKRGNNVQVKEIAKTIFECQPGTGKGYQWVVVDQRYRIPK